MALSMRMLRILAFGYIAMAVTQCLSGVMRGAGDTITPMWISIISTVVIRVPLAYTLAYLTRSPEYPTGRPESTFVSLLVAWTLGAIINYTLFRKGAWRTKGLKKIGTRGCIASFLYVRRTVIWSSGVTCPWSKGEAGSCSAQLAAAAR